MNHRLLVVLHDFCHARVDERGCRIAGWMRVCYAALFLIDRFLLGLDLNFFYTGPNALVTLDPSGKFWTLFRYYNPQEDDTVLWIVYYVGLVQGVFLLLGVAPRLQLAGILFHLVCFENHSPLLWDGQDAMFRTWALLFQFLPLHHVIIYGQGNNGNNNNNNNSSWPMWPFRLWQIYMTLVYLGASLGKLLNTNVWIGSEANALYNCIHLFDVYPGIWNPDILFNRIGPLKVMTWIAIAIEAGCVYTIWIPGLRTRTLVLIFLLHIGIDITMNMHCFEWLTLVGWCVFLVKPTQTMMTTTTSTVTSTSTSIQTALSVSVTTTTTTTTITTTRSGLFRKVFDTVVLLALVAIFTIDTIPIGDISKMSPTIVRPYTEALVRLRHQLASTWFMRKLGEYGISTMGPWDMFSEPADENRHWKAIVHKYDDSVVVWKMPDWRDLTSWQLKRHMRLISYYDTLSDEGAEYGQVALSLYIISLYQPGVVSLELIREYETFPEMPPGMGFWDKARQPMTYSSWERLLTLHAQCWDSHPHCPESAEQGQCDHASVQEMCPFSCALCEFKFVIDYTRAQGGGKYTVGEPFEEHQEHMYEYRHEEEEEDDDDIYEEDNWEDWGGYYPDEDYEDEDYEYHHYSAEWDETWDEEVDESGDEHIDHEQEEEDSLVYSNGDSGDVGEFAMGRVAEPEREVFVEEKAHRRIPHMAWNMKVSLVNVESSSAAQEIGIIDEEQRARMIRAEREEDHVGSDHEAREQQGRGEEL
eukprot:scaffold1139_cov174-Amphora_coffeaeformis.AAC.1